jgi:hypothetical protein
MKVEGVVRAFPVISAMERNCADGFAMLPLAHRVISLLRSESDAVGAMQT